MKVGRKSLLGLLTFAILFFCVLAAQKFTAEEVTGVAGISEPEEIGPSMLRVMSNGGFIGCGFFVAPDKIATNIHVMIDVNPGSTYVRSRYATWSVQGVTAYDMKNDLVILKVSGGGVPLPLGDSDSVQDGEAISVVKYSGVMEYEIAAGTLHSVRNTDKWLRIKIDIDKPIGTSGSALLNSQTEVIGIVAAGDAFYGYAAPSNALGALLDRAGTVESLAQWQGRKQISVSRYCTRGEHKLRAKRYEEAIVDLDKAIQMDPEFIDAYHKRATARINFGMSKVKSGDVKKAVILYQAASNDLDGAIALNPEYSYAYVMRGNVKVIVGNLEVDRGNAEKARNLYASAINDSAQAIKLEPKEYNAYFNQGFARFKLGELEYTLGNVREARDLYQKAIEDFAQVIKTTPEYTHAYNNRGYTKYLLGKSEASKGNMEESRNLYEAAIIDTNISIELNPDHSDPYYTRGIAKAALGDFEDAIANFDRAIEISASSAKAFYQRGLAKEALGQVEAAQIDYEKAKELNSDFGSRN